jgi:hypothetical protein
LFGHAKNDAALNLIPCKRLGANQVFTLDSMMAHNFSREIQMIAYPAANRAKAKRPTALTFQKLETIRRQILQSSAEKLYLQSVSTSLRKSGYWTL